MTSIVGLPPSAFLPMDRVFRGEKINIADSIGPIIISAQKFIPPENSGNSGATSIDTLIIVVSEPIKTGGSLENLLKFTLSCSQPYGQAGLVKPYVTPSISASGDTIKVLVNGNSSGAVPAKSCIYLNGDAGNVTDLIGNIPPQRGKGLSGQNRNLVIQGLNGYPPVAGLPIGGGQGGGAIDPKWVAANQGVIDPKTGLPYTGGGAVNWIPPADWPVGQGSSPGGIGAYNPLIPVNPRDTSAVLNPDNQQIVPMPGNFSAVKVIATGRYIAHINIFDNLGNHVRNLKQAFGYQNEMLNPARRTPAGESAGWYSFLVWDQYDKKRQKAGQGVYVWKIVFDFPDLGKQEVFYTRTGIVRNNDLAGTP
jgi:hypothetical protein